MKFLHTADWQLGKPFARIPDPDKAATVRRERIEAIHRMGDLVREHEAEFVVVAGDLFDSTTAEKSVVSAACSAIGKLGVPVYAIPGNHDHGGPGGLWEQDFFLREQKSLAPDFHILLERAPIEASGGTLLPCPLLRQHESRDPMLWLRDLDFSSLDPDRPRIVLAHGSVHGFEGDSGVEEEDFGEGGAANLLNLDRLPRDEIDYIALGDWHGTKEIDGAAWYAGTHETDRFPRGERNQPGHTLVVEVERGLAPRVERLRTGRLGWHVVDFSFASDGDVDRLLEQLDDLLGNRAGEDLLRLSLGGDLSLEAANRIEEEMTALEARLLRLRRKFDFRIEPSDGEIDALADRPGDPLLSRVAEGLFATAAGSGEEAEIARIALRELHSAVSS